MMSSPQTQSPYDIVRWNEYLNHSSYLRAEMDVVVEEVEVMVDMEVEVVVEVVVVLFGGGWC